VTPFDGLVRHCGLGPDVMGVVAGAVVRIAGTGHTQRRRRVLRRWEGFHRAAARIAVVAWMPERARTVRPQELLAESGLDSGRLWRRCFPGDDILHHCPGGLQRKLPQCPNHT
jgi:hypothetical protein